MCRALSLYKTYSQAELLALSQQVESDPASQAPPGGLFRLTLAARKKTADIAQAIAWHIADARKAEGKRLAVCGYSGRKSNK